MSNRHARGSWRPLGGALALSLLLHLMLLDRDGTDDGASRAPSGPPLHARLHRDAASPPGPLARQDEARAVTRVAEATATSRPHELAQPAPSVSPAPPALPETLPPPSQRPDGTGEGAGLRQYRLSLALAAAREKAPVAALAGDYRGRMEIRLAIAADGLLQTTQLLRGSGDERLDAAVIDMVGKAARSTPLPAVLLGQPRSIELPLEFGMSGE